MTNDDSFDENDFLMRMIFWSQKNWSQFGLEIPLFSMNMHDIVLWIHFLSLDHVSSLQKSRDKAENTVALLLPHPWTRVIQDGRMMKNENWQPSRQKAMATFAIWTQYFCLCKCCCIMCLYTKVYNLLFKWVLHSYKMVCLSICRFIRLSLHTSVSLSLHHPRVVFLRNGLNLNRIASWTWYYAIWFRDKNAPELSQNC